MILRELFARSESVLGTIRPLEPTGSTLRRRLPGRRTAYSREFEPRLIQVVAGRRRIPGAQDGNGLRADGIATLAPALTAMTRLETLWLVSELVSCNWTLRLISSAEVGRLGTLCKALV